MNRGQFKHASGGSGSVRIIGGHWRGTRLDVPNLPGLRPSADRVRETLFNWLLPALPGARVLDLFAGSGALGLEAVSRGAAHAQLVESDRQLAQALESLRARLDAQSRIAVHHGDALAFLRAAKIAGAIAGENAGEHANYDVVFLDPPFAAQLWAAVLELLPSIITADAWLYVESPVTQVPELDAQWVVHREGCTREVRYALYRRVTLPKAHPTG